MKRLNPRLTLPLTLGLLLALGSAAPSVGAADEPRKGPWVMDVTSERASVLVELTESAAVSLTLSSEGAATTSVSSEPATLHELVAEGLTANTLYEYELALPSGEALRGRFRTAPPPDHPSPIRFVVYGDNRTDHEAHEAVVASVREAEAELLVNTGDMVYLGSERDDWQIFFSIAQPLLSEVALFPVLGNHELARLGQGIENYRRYVRTPGLEERTYYVFDWGPLRFLMLDSNDEWRQGGAQWQWVEAELERARADESVRHLFAALHHGPISSGRHGPNPRMAQSGAERLLADGGVELVFSGHDHLYERGDADGLKYIVTGGGGAPLYPWNRRLPSQLAFDPVHHHVRVDVEGAEVRVHALRVDGSTIERCAFESGQSWRCEGRDSPDGPVANDTPYWHLYVERYGLGLGVGAGGALLLAWLWRRRRQR